MEKILKNYDDMRVMRMIKKQLIQCESTLELLRKEYEEKRWSAFSPGDKKRSDQSCGGWRRGGRIDNPTGSFKKEIQEIEEDKSKMAAFNAYTRQ